MTRPVRGIAVVVAASVAVLGLVGFAAAAANDITVGGVFVCTLTQGEGGLTADQRAVDVRQRITNVLSVQGFRSHPNLYVEVRASGSNALISVGDKTQRVQVLTVTPADAKGTGVSAYTLASQWGQKLAKGLGTAMPSSQWNLNYVRP